jgi:hypothetical protein
MLSLKTEALETIAKLLDTVDIDEIMYRLYVLDKIRKLHDLPRMGRVAPEIGDEDVRELSLYS